MSGDDPTSEQVLSLPPGGGAVAASGSDFDVDLNTGSAASSLPLLVPAGPNGIRPDLALRYHSGGGSDWLGLGWTLGLARITRRRGREADSQFALDGVGPIWPRTDGGWAPEVDTFGQRILGGPDTGWQLIDFSDTVHSLGSGPDSRLIAEDGTVVGWLLDGITDSTGNSVSYRWEPSGSHRRLAEVSWGRYQLRLTYQDRPDTAIDASLGTLLSIDSRLAAVELHRPALAEASLLRSWQLRYDDGDGQQRSLLAEVAQFGHGADGSSLAGATVRFDYTGAGSSSLQVLPRLPVSVRQPGTQFVDLDGDGLPDLLDLSSPRAQWWQNHGGGQFSGPHRPANTPGPLQANPQSVVFADLNGDGAAELMVLGDQLRGYYPLTTAVPASPVAGAPFGEPVRWQRAPSFDLADPNLRLLDLDGDGRADLLIERAGRWQAWLQQGDDGWSAQPVEIPAQDRPPVSLADPRFSFADLTGDGRLDAVRITGATVSYWPALGPRRWGAEISVSIPQPPAQLDPRRLTLADVDGDGCAELVYLDAGQVLLWRWVGSHRLAAPQVVAALPPVSPSSFRLIDLTGDGVLGILLDLPNGSQGYLRLLGQKPYLLERIRDDGATTEVSWRPSTDYAIADAAAGPRWRTFHPFPVHCVDQVQITDHSTGQVSTTSYRYHEGHYDSRARTFAGFGAVDRDDLGDASIPSLRTSTTFQLGLDPADPARPLSTAERRQFAALRGKPLTVITHDPDADPAAASPGSVVRYRYATVQRALAGGRISQLPYAETTVAQRWNGGPEPASTHTLTVTGVDAEGMVTGQRSVVQRAGLPPDRDVTISRQFATGGANLRLPCRVREVDADGTVQADSLTFFDGPTEVGLALGSATEGLTTRIEDLVLTDAMAAEVWGTDLPDLTALGYHRIEGETGWWVARSRLARDPTAQHLLRSRGPLGGVCATELDPSRHDVVSVTDPLGHQQRAEHDPRTGAVTTLVGVDGGVRRETFDLLGRVTGFWASTDPDGSPAARWSYDTSTMPVRVGAVGSTEDDPTSSSISYLDGRGAALAKLTPTGDPDTPWLVSGRTSRTARGQLAHGYLPYPVADPSWSALQEPDRPHSSFSYSFQGELLTETRADGTVLSWHREPGSVLISLQPAGATEARPKERHLLDGCGQVLSVGRWDGSGWVEQTYRWDHRGRPLTITTPDGVTHTLVHDLLGRIISHHSPDTGRTRRLIDALGSEVRTELATGAVTVREFDELRRPLKVWRNGQSGPPDVSWEYLRPGDPVPDDGLHNRIGRLWRVTDPLGTLMLGYDHGGRLVSKARSTDQVGWPVVSEAEYDDAGRLISATLPATSADGNRLRVSYQHDAIGRPVAASGAIDQVSFDGFGRTHQVKHSNGTITTMSYDAATGQLVGQTVTGPAGEVLREHAHRYDDERRLVGIDGGTAETSWAYGFDGLGRLASATADTGSAAFDYSPGGNLLTGPTGSSLTYQPGTSRLAAAAGVAHRYDDAGRVLHTGSVALDWDADDHLVGARVGESAISHSYDHTDARVLSSRDGVAYFIQAGDELVVTRPDGAAEPTVTVLIRFAGAVVATVDGSGRQSWLHPDVLGNLTLTTDLAGAVASRLSVEPWGNASADPADPLGGFLGRPADPTGLICLGRRWYDPSTGRFLSADPLAGGLYTLGAWNSYSYGLNNPVLLSDPSGLTSTLAIVGLALAISIVAVIAVATCGAALAGVAVLGVTFATGGLSAGTAVAVGIGAFGGALAGAVSADKAGGDVLLGALVGGLIGGACALVGGALGSAVLGGLSGAPTWASYGISGAAQGAIGGFGSGLASGFAGGKGSLGQMLLSATRSMIWGATMGFGAGAVMGGLFAAPPHAAGQPELHNYLEFGTLHKYGLGFEQGAQGVPAAGDIVDSAEGTTLDATLGVRHALTGTFSPGGDIAGNLIDVINVPRLASADLGFATTQIPGCWFAIDVSEIATAFAGNGLGAGLAAASVGADAAGFSYADQVILGLKGVPFTIGNMLAVFDDLGAFKSIKRDFNVFYGSSNPDD